MIKLQVRVNDTTDVERRMSDAVDAVPRLTATGAVDELSQSQYWPVRTGLSKASFGAVLKKNRVVITNDQDYAVHIEERNQPAYRTLREGLDRIVAERVDPQLVEILNG